MGKVVLVLLEFFENPRCHTVRVISDKLDFVGLLSLLLTSGLGSTDNSFLVVFLFLNNNLGLYLVLTHCLHNRFNLFYFFLSFPRTLPY